MLQHTYISERDANFFERSWQDVYTSDLSNSFRVTANAIRSLVYVRNPALSITTTKVLIVTPNTSSVPLFVEILQPTLLSTNTKMFAVASGEPIGQTWLQLLFLWDLGDSRSCVCTEYTVY